MCADSGFDFDFDFLDHVSVALIIMTYAVDWALKAHYLSILVSINQSRSSSPLT